MINQVNQMGSFVHATGPGMIIFFVILILWSLYWKYRSMWLAAKHNDRIWFAVLLVLNTAGILDMIYMYLLAKPGDDEYGSDDK